jgi:hypothetical protein
VARNKTSATRREPGDRRDVAADARPQAGAAPTATEPAVSQAAEVPGPSEHFAGHLKESAVALFLNASLGLALPQVDLVAYKLFRDRLLADCGDPTDPIEIILIEQIAMAHLICGYLYAKGTNSASVESAAVYLGAGGRLTGELRRTALALQAFRAASVRLGEMTSDGTEVPDGKVIDPEIEAQENQINSEVEANPGDEDDEPRILPFRRRATV